MSAIEIESLLVMTNALEEFDFAAADTILRKAKTLSRHLFGAESPHVAELENILFRPSHIIYNSGHYMNRVHWDEGTERLRRVLLYLAWKPKPRLPYCWSVYFLPERVRRVVHVDRSRRAM